MMTDRLTGDQAARLLGITRRTLYRWAEYGRIPPPPLWTAAMLAPYAGLAPMPKGPPRRRDSARYTVHRHRFLEQRGTRMHVGIEPTWEER